MIENVGSLVLTGKLEGVEVEIKCPTLEGEGWIENLSGAGEDSDSIIYKKCTVPKPGGTCKILKESFRDTTPEDSRLAYKGTAIVDELRGNVGGLELSKIAIEGCENVALNKVWKLIGTAIGEPNNENSTLKFTTTSGSSLKFGGQTATLTVEYKIEVEGGGKIKVF